MHIEEIIFKISDREGMRIKIDDNFVANTNATFRHFSSYIDEGTLSELARQRIQLGLTTKASEPIDCIINYSGICVKTYSKYVGYNFTEDEVVINIPNDAYNNILIKMEDNTKPISFTTFLTLLRMTCDITKQAYADNDLQIIKLGIQEGIKISIDVINYKEYKGVTYMKLIKE